MICLQSLAASSSWLWQRQQVGHRHPAGVGDHSTRQLAGCLNLNSSGYLIKQKQDRIVFFFLPNYHSPLFLSFFRTITGLKWYAQNFTCRCHEPSSQKITKSKKAVRTNLCFWRRYLGRWEKEREWDWKRRIWNHKTAYHSGIRNYLQF